MIKKLNSLLILIVLLISGCATIPVGENIPTYSIAGKTYYPLITLCDLRGVQMQYDPITRTVYLDKDSKSVNLRPGDALILVNNNVMRLNSPVDISHGTVAVPRQFKEQVFDMLFKPAALVSRKTGVAKIKLHK